VIVKQGGVKMKDFKNSTIVKVKCDCCGKDIECPEEMLKTSKKHMCYTCFQDPKSVKNFKDDELKNVHVDIPTEELTDTVADNFARMMVDEAFPKIWSEKKRRTQGIIKERSIERDVWRWRLYGYTSIYGFYGSEGEKQEITKISSFTTGKSS
jgi:hypothetical protein